MSTLKVDGIRSNSASSDAITLASDGTCTANITNRSNRNIVINGAQLIAQRGTSSTSSGYQALDRFPVFLNGCDENPTISQADIASGTTPYTLGFRKSLKITNGNQTSGAGSNDYIWIQNKIEAQDIANSGWNYLSASSYITLSFWVKSSVAQTFKGYIETIDGTAYQYPFETGSLSADTWTKITKSIPGNSNLQFDNNNGEGFKISIIPMMGTDKTSSSVTEDAWGTYTSSARIKDVTTTWYTTNDATFEITGVQLEVSDHATDFEHRSYAQEFQLCQRYYYKAVEGNAKQLMLGTVTSANEVTTIIPFPVEMRASPTLDLTYGNDYWRIAGGNLGGDKYIDATWTIFGQTTSRAGIYAAPEASLSSYLGESGYIDAKNSASFLAFTAEL